MIVFEVSRSKLGGHCSTSLDAMGGTSLCGFALRILDSKSLDCWMSTNKKQEGPWFLGQRHEQETS